MEHLELPPLLAHLAGLRAQPRDDHGRDLQYFRDWAQALTTDLATVAAGSRPHAPPGHSRREPKEGDSAPPLDAAPWLPCPPRRRSGSRLLLSLETQCVREGCHQFHCFLYAESLEWSVMCRRYTRWKG